MSEANPSSNPQDQSKSAASPPKKRRSKLAKDAEWGDVWAEPPHSEGDSLKGNSLEADQIFDASALDSVAFEVSDLTSEVITPNSQTLHASDSVPTNLSSIAAWSQETLDPAELPNLTDLITLIQELNQCNGALMDRVSQLEEDLEYSQTALQAEVGRTHDQTRESHEVPSSSNAQDWATVQEQITALFNQLEFAHQTNQRQQILIETLTGQLENGQERVAQLEREAALLQQHYNEQTQLLSKSEGTCRDLQARLQRQQRYTLQFKAALEKCLEMPTPQYEMGWISDTPEVPVALAAAPFLPKAQRIQPWSAHTQIAAMKSPWMNLQHLDLETESEQTPVAEPVSKPVKPVEFPASAADVSVDASPAEIPSQTHLNLPSFGLPLLQVSEDEQSLPVDPSLADPVLEQQVHRLTSDPALRQHLDAAVRPLADMLAEALLADQTASELSEGSLSETTSADELLASTMADAEDALWQDLARLIDVSAEDVVKASLSGDLAAFESINFNGLPPDHLAQPETMPKPATNESVKSEAVNNQAANNQAANSDASTVAPLIRRISQTGGMPPAAEQPQPANQPQPEPSQHQVSPGVMPTLANSSWPSPVVYPLRSTKKRQSLAMVDLPTFPKSEA